jgi:NTE family protein
MRRRARFRGPRVGVVMGGGGVLGAAWLAGALPALQERLQRPVGDVDLIVGTSAGSIMAAALRCGIPVDEIVAHQRGAGLVALPHLRDLDRDSGALPRLPRMRIGSPRLLATAALAPHRIHPWVAASALVLEGRGQLHTVGALVQALLALEAPTDAAAWPARGETWILAVDYDSGRRVAFGRPGAPRVGLPDAVVASCSIPGWYEPKIVAGRRYVDAGVRSATSLDLLARVPLDEVYVLAPMASFDLDRPFSPAARLERVFRRLITASLVAEVRKVRAVGARVTVLAPGPEDLAAIGPNLMDPARRLRVLETSLQTSPAALGAALRRTAAGPPPPLAA